MSDVEVRVSMLNINYGHNEKLLKACRPLGEYAWFIEKIREFLKDFSIENAVSMAISDMPETFLLKPFLMIHRSEVNEMLLTEYNEAEVMELFKEDGRREGREEGRKELMPVIEEKNKQLIEQDKQLLEQAAIIQKYKEKFGEL